MLAEFTVSRGECGFLAADLSAVADTRVRIRAPCKYCKAESSSAATATAVAASAATVAA